MPFTYPKKPEDWQTAYTRDDAHRDSGNQAPETSIIGTLASLLLPIYAAYLLFKVLLQRTNSVIGLLVIFIAVPLSAILISGFADILIQRAAFWFSTDFFSKFYLPPENIEPVKIIRYRLSGRMKLPEPLNTFFHSASRFKYIIAKEGDFENKDKWPVWAACNIGGPISLIVFDGCALYLERGNRFSRVVGPGSPFLEWYETVKYVADLRPKIKTDSFSVWTKDGISVKLTVRVESRIGDPAKLDPESGLVYPFDPVAVKKAIERFALRWPNPQEEPSEYTWVDAVWGQVTGIVPSYIGSRMMDDILLAERNGGQILSPEATNKIFDDLNKATNGFGVYVTDFQIMKIEIPAEVTRQHLDYWEAERQGIATIIDGQAKAFSIRTREKARADAQRDLILAIADGLEKNQSKQFTEPLLLSLSGVLDGSLKDPLTRAFLAKESLDTLEKLQKILDKPT